MSKTTAIAALISSAAASSDHWAVLVAGSNTYMNYRHQSDICHAYQIAKANGIPEDQIIQIAYDDIANNSQNPFPGKLFNKPTEAGTAGVDVYEGCKIDYSGSDATAETVLKVLKGDTSVGGKVLKSDKDSKVFFYFADHGAPGLVAMPVGGYLMANDLHAAFQYMNENEMYNQMTVYMESCESGSMFENLLEDNINIYAVSASNSRESSWAAYCAPDDYVDGTSVGSCLGDLFSVNWMEDTDAANLSTETLQEQFETVKTKTTRSPVLQWGELDWTTEPIGMFEGDVDTATEDIWSYMGHQTYQHVMKASGIEEADAQRKAKFAVDSRDVKLHYLYNKVMRDASPENHAALMEEVNYRMKVDEIFKALNPNYTLGTQPTNIDFDCYSEMIEVFENACFPFEEYSMKHMGQLVNECEGFKFFPEAKETMVARFSEVCGNIVF